MAFSRKGQQTRVTRQGRQVIRSNRYETVAVSELASEHYQHRRPRGGLCKKTSGRPIGTDACPVRSVSVLHRRLAPVVPVERDGVPALLPLGNIARRLMPNSITHDRTGSGARTEEPPGQRVGNGPTLSGSRRVPSANEPLRADPATHRSSGTPRRQRQFLTLRGLFQRGSASRLP